MLVHILIKYLREIFLIKSLVFIRKSLIDLLTNCGIFNWCHSPDNMLSTNSALLIYETYPSLWLEALKHPAHRK
jgi:hypothetical protein